SFSRDWSSDVCSSDLSQSRRQEGLIIMSKAVRVHSHGGPEALTYEEIVVDRPQAGQVLIRHTAIGLNFLDTYFRSGLYPAPAGRSEARRAGQGSVRRR